VQLLGGTDIHSSNVVASGEHPFCIDLEALLHPFLGGAGDASPATAARVVLAQSALRTGMLPVWPWDEPAGGGLDISAVGSDPNQVVRRRVWLNQGTDEMRLAFEDQPIGRQPSHVVLAGKIESPQPFEGAITEGFLSAWDLVTRFRTELLAESSPLEAFQNSRGRLILQNTIVYHVVQSSSLHPDLLQDGLQREAALDRIWLAVSDDATFDELVAAARDEMWAGDTPYLEIEERDVIVGSRRFYGILNSSGLETVRKRLGSMTRGEGRRHVELIQASLATLPQPPERENGGIAVQRTVCPEPNWLAEADAIGRAFVERGVHSSGAVTWTGLRYRGQRWRVGPLPSSLYDGLGGISLFLGYLAHATDEPRYADLCRQTSRALLSQLEDVELQPNGLGAYTGWAGLLYLRSHLLSLGFDVLGQDVQTRAFDEISSSLRTDTTFDWLDGAAGCIAALLCAFRNTGDGRALDLAVECGRYLIRQSKTTIDGTRVWPSPDGTVLTGLAHGASGVALGLFRLASACGDHNFEDAARSALSFEAQQYDSVIGNWPDLRDPAQRRFMAAWCHGAAGIGIVRVELGRDSVEWRQEASAAVDAVRGSKFGGSPCLCHGDLGKLELLLHAGFVQEAQARAAALRRRTGWRYGPAVQRLSLGLMQGSAGIGFALLRLSNPDRFPSVLSLAAASDLLRE
jgi:type 2 lantibiotic biosynthesis protein LanM